MPQPLPKGGPSLTHDPLGTWLVHRAHPRDEHFVPLQVVAAAAGGAPATKEHGAWAMGTLSLASYVFAAQ